MTFNPRPPSPSTVHRRALALAGVVSIIPITGCVTAASASVRVQISRPAVRPSVTITLTNGVMTLPSTIPGGVVDIVLDASTAKTRSHHVAFFRRNSGVDSKRLLAASDAEFSKLVTYEGGDAELPAGHKATITLDLEPGNYTVADFDDNVQPITSDAVVTAAKKAPPPASRGTVTIGPDMTFALPTGFNAAGIWHFTNTDKTTAHEAAIVRLHAGAGITDLIAWAKNPTGPPPADVLGGFGALGPGKQGWMDLGTRPRSGHYALVCLLPDDYGVMHLARGMAHPFTIN